MDHAPDVIAERFELLRLAGRGGMGAVYEARDRLTGVRVAVKLLQRQGAREDELFAREARALAELRHPGVVGYVAHGQTPGGDLYLVMEWLAGEDLAARLGHRGLTLPESIALVQRAAEALGAAHARGIVHRDVKPANLFLVEGDPWRVKVLDFGIARLLSATRGMTRTGLSIGTPGYLAPEQARGERDVDARVDVFSLGCVLFECVTGAAPYGTEHGMAAIAKVLFGDVPRARAVRPELPAELDELLAALMSADRAHRPPDGAAVAARLAALAPQLAHSASVVPDVPAHEAAPPARRKALTGDQQELLAVVLLARAAGDTPSAPATSDGRASTLEADAPAARLRTVSRTAAAFGGRVFPLAGDRVLVAFTSHGSVTDQCARAARCALALRARLTTPRLALATGPGEIEGATPVGEAITRAEELLRDAPAHDPARAPAVTLDALTARLLGPEFDVTPAGESLSLRGEREAPDTAGAALLGRATPLVGRDWELAALAGIFAQCAAEPVARAVILTGDAGAGKSRVRGEFVARVRERHPAAAVLVARGDPISAGSPFGMLAQALRRALGLAGAHDAVDPGAACDALAARVQLTLPGEHGQRVAEFLGELVGVSFPDAGREQLAAARRDPMLRGDQMRRALEDYLGALCDSGPVLVVLEDLQWGDLPSVSFLDAALRNLAERPFMVLAVGRPDTHSLFPGLWQDRFPQAIRLAPLTRGAVTALVRHALDARATEDVVTQVVARAEGNPFCVEEILRVLVDGRAHELPGTVLAMVQARLSAMDPSARRVLRAASVFGKTFPAGGVVALLGGEARARGLVEWLDALVADEVVVRHAESRFPGDADYAFRQETVREASYAMLTVEDRALGHALALDWLTRAGETDPLSLAEHAERGQQPARAAAYYTRAAEQALEGNDYAGAVARAERAVELGAVGAARGQLRLVQAVAHRWRGENPLVEMRATEAAELLPRGGRPWFRAVTEVIAAAGTQQKYPLVEQWVAAALAANPRDDAAGEQVMGLCRAAMIWLFAGRYESADALRAEVHGRAAAHTDRTDGRVQGWVHRMDAEHAVHHGDMAAAAEALESATEAFGAAGDARMVCVQRSVLGYVYAEIGEYARAEAVLREAIAAADRMGLSVIGAVARQNLGYVLASGDSELPGRLEDARRHAERAAETFSALRNGRLAGGAQSYLARIALLAGDAARAEREAVTAVELLADAPTLRPMALAELARALLAQGHTAQAMTRAGRSHGPDARARRGRRGRGARGRGVRRSARVERAHGRSARGHRDGPRATSRARREDLTRRVAPRISLQGCDPRSDNPPLGALDSNRMNRLPMSLCGSVSVVDTSAAARRP